MIAVSVIIMLSCKHEHDLAQRSINPMKIIPSTPSNRGPVYRVGNGQTSDGASITARELGTNPAALGNMSASQVRAIHQQTRAMEQQAEFAKLVISQLKKQSELKQAIESCRRQAIEQGLGTEASVNEMVSGLLITLQQHKQDAASLASKTAADVQWLIQKGNVERESHADDFRRRLAALKHSHELRRADLDGAQRLQLQQKTELQFAQGREVPSGLQRRAASRAAGRGFGGALKGLFG